MIFHSTSAHVLRRDFYINNKRNEKDESNNYNIMLQPREDDSRMY